MQHPVRGRGGEDRLEVFRPVDPPGIHLLHHLHQRISPMEQEERIGGQDLLVLPHFSIPRSSSSSRCRQY